MTKREKTAWAIFGIGIASGAAAMILWPLVQKLRVGGTVSASGSGHYLPGTRTMVFDDPSLVTPDSTASGNGG